MTDDAVKNLLDDYALGEKRREAEAARLAAKAAVAATVDLGPVRVWDLGR